jgi:hypothetical protein
VPVTHLRPDAIERAPKFAIVGNYLDQPTSNFVKHVALLRSEEDLCYSAPDVRVWQMGPPLVAGVQSRASVEGDATCVSHLIGVVELIVSTSRESRLGWQRLTKRIVRPDRLLSSVRTLRSHRLTGQGRRMGPDFIAGLVARVLFLSVTGRSISIS